MVWATGTPAHWEQISLAMERTSGAFAAQAAMTQGAAACWMAAQLLHWQVRSEAVGQPLEDAAVSMQLIWFSC